MVARKRPLTPSHGISTPVYRKFITRSVRALSRRGASNAASSPAAGDRAWARRSRRRSSIAVWVLFGLLATGYLPVYGCSIHGRPDSAMASQPFAIAERSHYSTEPEPEAKSIHPDVDAIRKVVLARWPEARGDGRLATLARWALHERFHGEAPLTTLELDRTSRRLGITAPFPILLFVDLRTSTWSDDLRKSLAAQPRSTQHNQLGIHVDDSGWGVVALASCHVSIAPIPRRIEPGDMIDLHAELADGWHSPEWLMTAPDGKVRRVSANLEHRLEELEAGTHQIELLARGPFGLEVVANFPVGVGEDPTVENADLTGIQWTPTADTFMEAVNRIRRSAGLPPLTRDPTLDRIADSHTRDMASGRFFAHESPTRGSTHDRMREAGFPYQRYGENIGRARSSQEIHALWLRSPGHRANLLDPGFTHIGLGVTTDGTSAPPVVIATQVFGGSRSREEPR